MEKHHTRADVAEAIEIVHGAGIALRPTWVPFTPWTTLDDYLDLLQFIDTHGLVYHVDPVQYAVRLLIPPGSYLLNRPETKELSLVLDASSFSYTWVHDDARMDELHKTVNVLVESDARAGVDPLKTFYRIWRLAADMRGQSPPRKKQKRIYRHHDSPKRGSAEQSLPMGSLPLFRLFNYWVLLRLVLQFKMCWVSLALS